MYGINPQRLCVVIGLCLLLPCTGVWAAPSVASPSLVTAPVRLGLMPGNRLLVSDSAANAVFVLAARDGRIERSIAIDGRPVAVAWGCGRIFVGNEARGQVEAYNLGGHLLASYGAPGSILLPNAVAVDEQGEQLLVLDAKGKVIKVFALDGTFLYDLITAGQLHQPSAMAFDPMRKLVLVSDFGPSSSSLFKKPQASIRLFDLSGNEKYRFVGTFVRPQGLRLTADNRLFVADSVAGNVQILDGSSGVRIDTLGSFGGGPGQLNLPLDVAVAASGVAYVSDNRNGRIVTFAAGGTQP